MCRGAGVSSHTDCLGRWGWWNPGLCAALPSLALRVPNKALTSRAQPPLTACTWARSTPWLLPPLGRRPSLELAGSHSFLPHFRQAGSRCGLGQSWAGTAQTTPSPNHDVCTSSVNWKSATGSEDPALEPHSSLCDLGANHSATLGPGVPGLRWQ